MPRFALRIRTFSAAIPSLVPLIAFLENVDWPAKSDKSFFDFTNTSISNQLGGQVPHLYSSLILIMGEKSRLKVLRGLIRDY